MGTAARVRGGGEPLKQRVNRCLLKLSDRDTEAMAAAELDAIARALATDELGAFVSADQCAQMAAALATAAAVEASAPTADLASYIHKLQPRLLKLLRSNAFKAKPALISLIGVSASAAGASEVTASVPYLRDTIASDDWAARKAAAEALAALALEHKDLLVSYKSSCITMFEARRFDKVKIVRDSMNRMIDAWKEIPDVEEDECSSGAPPASQSQRRSSLGGSASDGRYPVASATRRHSLPASRSPPPDASPSVNKRHSSSSARNKKHSPPSHHKASQAKNRDYKVDIAVTPDATPIKVVTEEKLLKGGNVRSRLEARRMLFQDGDDRATKVGGLKAGSRVVPYVEGGNMEEISEAGGGSERFQTGYKDEGLSEIRSQLLQIENQQSSLLDLIQKFMGKSENGMNSLETRVHGLEMALDEISRDLAASSGRTSNSEAHVNSCCILNPKFWRRHDAGRYSSRFSVSDGRNSSEGSRTSHKWERQKFGLQGGFVTNPLAEPNISSAARTVTAQEGRRRDLTLPKSR
uniref:TORTIFOLIA1/SINE1-2 N-terminal domain-containing protein n=1 Tax=Leersia perrieri TaxID=77586 RepID=A0A0D9VKU1_9ORYZ